MTHLTKKATIYFEPSIHNILKEKASESSRSISELVNEAIFHEFSEDGEDLETFKRRGFVTCEGFINT